MVQMVKKNDPFLRGAAVSGCPGGLFQIGGVLSGPNGLNKCSWFEGCNYLSGAP